VELRRGEIRRRRRGERQSSRCECEEESCRGTHDCSSRMQLICTSRSDGMLGPP
jgi:hypothetical protein